jgi:hypothetical protein
MREKRNAYRLLVGNPERKRIGRSRHRSVDNTKMDLVETGLGELDWIGVAQIRYRWKALVNKVMNFRVQ